MKRHVAHKDSSWLLYRMSLGIAEYESQITDCYEVECKGPECHTKEFKVYEKSNRENKPARSNTHRILTNYNWINTHSSHLHMGHSPG